MEVLPIPNAGGVDKYLGFPSLVWKYRGKAFTFICEKVKKQIDSWMINSMSFIERGVLLKLIAIVILIYTMQFFIFPQEIC